MFKRWILSLTCAAALLLAATPALPAHAAEEHATEHTTAHAAAEGETHHELLPDMSKAETWYSAVWVLIIFCVLLAVLYKTAWKNVLAGLKAREERIRRDIADADAARAKAEASLKDYQAQLATAEEKVREMIARATAEGERMATSIRMQAQQEAESTKERAIKDIDAARTHALQEIYTQAADLSVSVAERILRRNLNVDDQRHLVEESLGQLQTVRGRA